MSNGGFIDALNMEPMNGDFLVNTVDISEKMGFSIILNKTDYSYQITKGDKILTGMSGSKNVVIDQKDKILPIEASLVENSVYMPIKFMADFCGLLIDCRERFGNKPYKQLTVTALPLLDDSDVVTDSENYYEKETDIKQIFYLRDTGVTPRGIRIGDPKGKVFEKYGSPHHTYTTTFDKLEIFRYVTPPYGGSLGFRFDDNDKVAEIIIQGVD